MRWPRKRWVWAGILLLGAGFAGLHAVARSQARGMLHFVEGGQAPERPEDLSLAAKLRLLLGGIEIPRPCNDRNPGDLGLIFAVDRATAEDGTGLELWRVPAGSEPRGRVLLVHGYASAKATLLAEAAELHGLGFEVWLVDLRGSGGSDGDRTSLGWEEASDVAAAVAAMGEGPLVIYGQSMGAVAALRAVHLELVAPDALILEAPFDDLRTTVGARFRAMGLPTWPFAEVFCWHGGRELGLDPDEFQPWRWARSVTCPVLHLYGDEDRRVPVEASERIQAALSAPFTAVPFEGVGHRALLDARPNRWRAAVRAFLDQAPRCNSATDHPRRSLPR